MLFVGLGLILIAYPGIQNDEALFASPLYAPRFWLDSIPLFGADVPTMLMSYLGTLKTWLYIPVFRIWAPSPMSIRLPVLLLGGTTVWLFFLLLKRVGGQSAALAGAVLLATDASFLLTTCFDWGPVALQHLLCVSGILLLVGFYEHGNNWFLSSGFFVFGLALWDKALFIWTLAGLGIATILVFSAEIVKLFSARRLAIAAFSFLAGASPFCVYNYTSSGGTIGAYSTGSLHDVQDKFTVLRATLDGSALMGYITADDSSDDPRMAISKLERVAIWIHLKTAMYRRSLNFVALLIAIGLVPLLWRERMGRPLRFTVVLMAAIWLQMAVTKGTGGSAHHAILLWPFPVFLIATAFSAVSAKFSKWGGWILAGVITLMAGENLLIYNEYLEHFARNGEIGSWTDGIYPLAHRLSQYGSREIYVIDWGMIDSLRLLDQGKLLLHNAGDLFINEELSDTGRKSLIDEISDPSHIFLAYTTPMEQFKGVGERLSKWACESGYNRVPLETVKDRNGRAVFEIFHFAKSGGKVSQPCVPAG